MVELEPFAEDGSISDNDENSHSANLGTSEASSLASPNEVGTDFELFNAAKQVKSRISREKKRLAISEGQKRFFRTVCDLTLAGSVVGISLLKVPTGLVDNRNGFHFGQFAIILVAIICVIAGLRFSLRNYRVPKYFSASQYGQVDDYERVRHFLSLAEKLEGDELARAAEYQEKPAVYTPRIAHRVSLEESVLKHKISVRLDFNSIDSRIGIGTRVKNKNEDTARGSSDKFALSREAFFLCYVDKGHELQQLTMSINSDAISVANLQQSNAITVGVLNLRLREIRLLCNEWNSDKVAMLWVPILSAAVCPEPIGAGSEENHERKRFNRVLTSLSEELVKAATKPGCSAVAGETQKKIEFLVELLDVLSSRFAIWCRFTRRKDSRYYRVEAEYSLPEYRDFLDSSSKRRARYGLTPRKIYYRAELARQTAGYSFDFKLGENLYFYDGTVITVSSELARKPRRTDREVKLEDFKSVDGIGAPAVEMAGIGTSRAQARARDLHRLESEKDKGKNVSIVPYIAAEFREIPPGNLGLVLGLALYVTVLALLVGVNYPAVVYSRNPSGGTVFSQAWVTILGTVPAIISAWIISKFSEGIPRASATTVAMMLWGVLNAFFLVVLSALAAIRRGRIVVDFHDGSSIASMSWMVLMCSTCMHLLVVIFVVGVDSFAYYQRVFSSDVWPDSALSLLRKRLRDDTLVTDERSSPRNFSNRRQ